MTRTSFSSPYRTAKGVMVCFDVTKPRSLNSAEIILDEFQRSRFASPLATMLVGTKMDSRKKSNETIQRAMDIAARYQCPCALVSAKQGTGVEGAFRRMASDSRFLRTTDERRC